MKIRYLVGIVTCFVVILFCYTGIHKLIDHERFQKILGKSVLVSAYAEWLSWIIPLLELTIVGLILINKTFRLGLLASFTLMLAFSLYVTYMVVYSVKLPCSCGGIINEMTWKQHLFFNWILTILIAAAFWMSKQRGNESGFKQL